MDAVKMEKRVIVEHFDLIRPLLPRNADLLIGVGEQVIVTRPNMFGPEPSELAEIVHSSLRYRLMAHTAEDLCEMYLPTELLNVCHHDDIHHGFIMSFYEYMPKIDIAEMERRVREDIARDLSVAYADESHIRVGTRLHSCSGPRPHVTSTGQIEDFHLYPEIIFDDQRNRYLVVGFVGEHAADRIKKLQRYKQAPDMLSPFVY